MLRKSFKELKRIALFLCAFLFLAGAGCLRAEPGATHGVAANLVDFTVFPAGSPSSEAVVDILRRASSALGAVPETIGELNRWSDSLTNALRMGGFPVSQVLVTEQNWRAARNGEPLVFSAFPGRIHEIQIENKTRVKDARLHRLIAKALCDDVSPSDVCLLNTARLERATQLLQDIPGVAIAKAPQFSSGGSTGDIDVRFYLDQQGKAITGDVFVDNKGIQSTGLYRLGVTAAGNNFFGLGESYALTLTGTEKKMWTGSLTGSVPILDDGLRLTMGVTRQQYSINAVTQVVGVANTAQLGLLYPVTRGLDSNVWLGTSYLHSRTKNDYKGFYAARWTRCVFLCKPTMATGHNSFVPTSGAAKLP